ncbi:MAG: HEAT repeat domain-containing protein [Phycisphaeraceae bacterium]
MNICSQNAGLRALTLGLALFAGAYLTGCESAGVTYESLYEGFFGDEPPPAPSVAVAMMFNREDADQRRQGISWIASSPFGGEEEYVNSYRLLVEDPDPGVRAASATALGRHGSIQDAMTLATLLKDENDLVRWQAADGLRKLHNPAAIPALIERLDPDIEDDADTRATAALALGQYPDDIVFARLATALEQGSFNVVNAAHGSLKLLTGTDQGIEPQAWAAWFEQTDNPFANQQTYTYNLYQPDRDWFDQYVTFWNNSDGGGPKGPQTPRGLSDGEGG